MAYNMQVVFATMVGLAAAAVASLPSAGNNAMPKQMNDLNIEEVISQMAEKE